MVAPQLAFINHLEHARRDSIDHYSDLTTACLCEISETRDRLRVGRRFMSKAREDESRVARSATEDPETATPNEQRRNETVLDDGEFEECLKQRYSRLLRVALRATRNLADAEELVQEVCVKAYVERQKLDGQEDALCWFVHVMLNAWRDQLRKRRRFVNYALSRDPHGSAHGAATQEPAHLLSSIFEFVETLDPPIAAVWYLAELEGESNPAIAAELKIPVGTAAGRLSRARLAVREYVNAPPVTSAATAVPSATIPPASEPQIRDGRPSYVRRRAEQSDAAEAGLRKGAKGSHD